MSSFIGLENARQSEFKQTSGSFTEEARADGVYLPSARSGNLNPLPYCLPVIHAAQNLYPEIREEALAYFREKEIEWHDKRGEYTPSNHLRDSQVCCVNFLFPFTRRPDALADLLRPVFPALKQILPVEDPGYAVAFEWIGERNYLNEAVPEIPRRRGKGCTSSDAAVRFEVDQGGIEIALLNWKYTERCDGSPKQVSKKGTDRVAIYRPFYEQVDCPLDTTLVADVKNLFYDPFDQLMRLQFLAREMEKAQELAADRVTVVHVEPAANTEGTAVTSPALKSLGRTVVEVWQRLVAPPDRFAAISTEELFGRFPLDLTARYRWLPNRFSPSL